MLININSMQIHIFKYFFSLNYVGFCNSTNSNVNRVVSSFDHNFSLVKTTNNKRFFFFLCCEIYFEEKIKIKEMSRISENVEPTSSTTKVVFSGRYVKRQNLENLRWTFKNVYKANKNEFNKTFLWNNRKREIYSFSSLSSSKLC